MLAAWMLAGCPLAPPAMRMPPPVMQDRFCGGAVPFSPAGTARDGSTGNAPWKQRRAHLSAGPATSPARTHLTSPNSVFQPPDAPFDATAAAMRTTQGLQYCGGAMPFAPIGTAGGGSTASAPAYGGMSGAVATPWGTGPPDALKGLPSCPSSAMSNGLVPEPSPRLSRVGRFVRHAQRLL